MLSIFYKVFGMAFLAFFGLFMNKLPEQSVLLSIGVGLTIFAIAMRRRQRGSKRRLQEKV